jgi:hypothetical protein
MIPAYIKVLELKRREHMKTLLVLLSLTVFAPLSFGMSMENSEEISYGQKLHQTGGEICKEEEIKQGALKTTASADPTAILK